MAIAKTKKARGVTLAATMAVGIATLPRVASAHFVLQQPPSWMSQDSLGSPQKLGPCGDEGGGTATNSITQFRPGDTITVTINEVVFHPGHYRVALSVNDRSELPVEPQVMATTSTPCGSVPIDPAPAFPVLADGVLVHTTAFATPQSFQVTLPTNVTCTRCTLQIIEFMSNHPLNNPGGCFYHHCADISIQPVSNNTGGAPSTNSGGSTGIAAGGAAALGGSLGTGGVLAAAGSFGTGGMAAPGGSLGTGGMPSIGTGADAGTSATQGSSVGSCSCAMRRTHAVHFTPLLLGLLAARQRRRSRSRGE